MSKYYFKGYILVTKLYRFNTKRIIIGKNNKR